MFFKRSLLAAFTSLLALSFLLTACGSTTPSGSTPSAAAPASTPTATATSLPASTPTFTVDNSNAFIKTLIVDGQATKILTDTHGNTLYINTLDPPNGASCTCSRVWQPLLYHGSGTPTSSTQLPGALSVVTSPSGPQVEYQKHLLYICTDDTGLGSTRGALEGTPFSFQPATVDLPVNTL